MGLEVVDMVIQTEDAFGFDIPDEDMFEMRTVGQYYDYILRRLGECEQKKCLSSALFYRVRRALNQEFNVPRKLVTNDATLGDIIPLEGRRKHWKDLGKALTLALPSLKRPSWVDYALGLAALAVFTTVLTSAKLSMGSSTSGGFWTGVFGSIVFYVAAWCLTAPLAKEIPASCATVRGFTTQVLRSNFGVLKTQEKAWHPDEVWETLKAIIVYTIKVDPDEITKDARFVDDLGMG